ncbi:MAG TPA: AbiEi antitoxin N-terminal domain-containing protein [Solirubrobacterales bacterium]|nr:AbiEi antitoxin N-terminal domain-containing protein [Solirubrobacterales bacterium]
MRTHQALAELAGRQYGVVSLDQLRTLGYSRDTVARAARSGRLHRLHRGVYAVGHRRLSWHGHCLAAALACGPDAVASHRSAAWLWGLLDKRPAVIDVTATTRRHRRPFARIHHAPLTDADRANREGIPVTALPRTLLDLAAVVSAKALDRAVERAEQAGRFDLGAIEDLLARAGRHRGVPRLRRALVIYREEPAFTRSGLERRFLELVRWHGFPEPAVNYNVAGYELDFYWEEERFAVELDAYETHGSRRSFEADRERDVRLKILGVETVRVTGHRLASDPEEVVDSLKALLAGRSSPPSGGTSAAAR